MLVMFGFETRRPEVSPSLMGMRAMHGQGRSVYAWLTCVCNNVQLLVMCLCNCALNGWVVKMCLDMGTTGWIMHNCMSGSCTYICALHGGSSVWYVHFNLNCAVGRRYG